MIAAWRGTPRKASTRGFTLIELLVVVAVIAVLIALSLPVLGRCRRVAIRVKCGGRLKQIALAYDMYLDDYGGRFLTRTNGNYDFGGWQGDSTNALTRPVNHYLGLPVEMTEPSAAEAFRCPADRGGPDGSGPTYMSLGTSYQASPALVNLDLLPATPWFPLPWRTIHEAMHAHRTNLRRDKVARPADQIWIGDFHWVDQWDPMWTWACATFWHGDRHRFQIVFLDHHVNYVRIIKGLYITPDYRIQPFAGLDGQVQASQKQEPCACRRP